VVAKFLHKEGFFVSPSQLAEDPISIYITLLSRGNNNERQFNYHHALEEKYLPY
jgi:hypothetical protein